MREREGILRIMRDARKAPKFLRECILKSGIGDPHSSNNRLHSPFSLKICRVFNLGMERETDCKQSSGSSIEAHESRKSHRKLKIGD